ncbi:DDE-type integrase/transposase/recombinase [Paracraurococcus ruber]|uniref:DDE-type integrase/transposase/recombinase n=1 Tax=Paracraurococcus ruber TaxID=77675 RepID=UPI0038D00F92
MALLVSDQLLQFRTHAAGPRCRGRSHGGFPLIFAYTLELEKRIRPHLRLSNGSWQINETSIRMTGRWKYLFCEVESRGQTIDCIIGKLVTVDGLKSTVRCRVVRPNKCRQA